MQEKQVYEYAVIRVVPRVDRGEFLNVGILLYSKKLRFLEMRYHLNEDRLRIFSEALDIQEVKAYLEAWEFICQGDPKGGRIAELAMSERFRWLSAAKSTILQCSQVHTGRCSDPISLLERLLQQYVF